MIRFVVSDFYFGQPFAGRFTVNNLFTASCLYRSFLWPALRSDDCREMSSWYVFNAIGFYPYSPADPEYIVSVPLFSRVNLSLNHHKTFTIVKKNSGLKIDGITVADHKLDGYFLSHAKLAGGGKMVIATE